MAIPVEQENIIKLLGIESLPDEEKISIVEKVTTLVEKRLLVRVYESLDALRQKEFSEVLDKEDAPGVQEFLDRHAPNLPELLEEEVLKVKQELANWSESLA